LTFSRWAPFFSLRGWAAATRAHVSCVRTRQRTTCAPPESYLSPYPNFGTWVNQPTPGRVGQRTTCACVCEQCARTTDGRLRLPTWVLRTRLTCTCRDPFPAGLAGGAPYACRKQSASTRTQSDTDATHTRVSVWAVVRVLTNGARINPVGPVVSIRHCNTWGRVDQSRSLGSSDFGKSRRTAQPRGLNGASLSGVDPERAKGGGCWCARRRKTHWDAWFTRSFSGKGPCSSVFTAHRMRPVAFLPEGPPRAPTTHDAILHTFPTLGCVFGRV